MTTNEIKTQQNHTTNGTSIGSGPATCQNMAHRQPYYRVSAAETGWDIAVYLPGFTKEELDVSVEGKVLTVKTKGPLSIPETWRPISQAYESQPYYLELYLGQSVDDQAIQAKVEAGVLELHLAKRKSAQKQSINIT